MQTDILQRQLQTSLQDLRVAIDKFEKHSSPSTQYAEQLHTAIHQTNKLVSAYLVLKEHKDVSPDINLHMKLMSVPSTEEKIAIVEPIKQQVVVEPVKEKDIPIESVKDFVIEKVAAPIIETNSIEKEYPKMSININDKFRFINELFASNANEYHIAVEQMNAVSTLIEMTNYLRGLKSIYGWDDDNDVVKNLYALAHKRFS